MSFALNCDNIPSLRDYCEALRFWEKTKPWRNGYDDNVRPLDKENRSKHHVTIRKIDDMMVCRLHSTDVVTYYEDGRVDVDVSYGSRSTDAFIAALLRGTPVSVWTNHAEATVWMWSPHGGKPSCGYLIDGYIAKFDSNFILQNPEMIRTIKINGPAAKKLRKETRFEDFAIWRNAYETMHGHPDHGWKSKQNPGYRPNSVRTDDVAQMLLDGPDSWVDLAAKCSTPYILTCLYTESPDVFVRGEKEFFSSYSDYNNWRTLDRKYGHLVR